MADAQIITCQTRKGWGFFFLDIHAGARLYESVVDYASEWQAWRAAVTLREALSLDAMGRA